MSKLDKNAVLEILLLAIQIGVPAVKKLIEAWDKDEITLDERTRRLNLLRKSRLLH